MTPDRWPPVTDALVAEVVAALRSGRLGYSDDCVTRDFEEAWAAYHGARYAVAVNSGTTALAVAYRAAGMRGRGGEVLVGAYGFFATASALLPLGLRPVFCDVTPEGALDPASAARAIGPLTRGIAVTHVAGHPAPMPALLDLAATARVPLVEDGSHAHGARLAGTLVGRFGRAAAFSCQTGKMVSGGEGGVVMTDDAAVFRRACALANFRRAHGSGLALPARLAETGWGCKLRMGPLEAAMAHHHLRRLDRHIAMRRARLDRLTALLRAARLRHFAPPETAADASRGAFYEYPLRLLGPDPAMLRPTAARLLAAEGVRLRPSNTRALHTLPLFARARRVASLAVAERLDAATLMLPTFTTEPLAIVDAYAAAIARVDALLP